LIEVRVDKEIRADAFTWLQPRAHLWRDIKEGVIRESMKVNNNYVDAAIYGILKGECKWV